MQKWPPGTGIHVGMACALTLSSCATLAPIPGLTTSVAGVQGAAGPGGAVPVQTAGGLKRFKAASSSLVFSIGDEKPLVTLIRAEDGSIPTDPFTWAVSNERIASINPSTNTVKALQSGTVILTATLQSDPTNKVIIELNVVESQTVKLIKVDPATPALQIGGTVKLVAQVYLADGQINGNVSWSSSDDTIATVNPTTGEVSALKEGKVSIVAAYSLDPKYKGLAELTVTKEKPTATAAPSATPVIFGPGATPIPAATATSVPNPTPAGSPAANSSPNSPKTVEIEPGRQIFAIGDVVSDTSNQTTLVFDGYKIIHNGIYKQYENGDEIIQRGENLLVALAIKNTGSGATDGIVGRPDKKDYNIAEGKAQIYVWVNGSLYSARNYGSLLPGESRFGVKESDTQGYTENAGYTFSIPATANHGANLDFKLVMGDKYGNKWEQELRCIIP